MKTKKNQIAQFFMHIYRRNKYVFVIMQIMKKLNNENDNENASAIYNLMLKLPMFVRRDIQLIYELSMM